MQHKIYKEFAHFQKKKKFKKDQPKKSHVLGQLLHFLQRFVKDFVQKFIRMKKYFWTKNHAILV